jgi:hypothetical protein
MLHVASHLLKPLINYHLYLNLPIKPHLEPRPTKGGIDLCQVDKVYLYPFLIKVLTSLVLNP